MKPEKEKPLEVVWILIGGILPRRCVLIHMTPRGKAIYMDSRSEKPYIEGGDTRLYETEKLALERAKSKLTNSMAVVERRLGELK